MFCKTINTKSVYYLFNTQLHMTLKEKIDELIAENKPEKVFELIIPIAKSADADTHNTFILLKAQFTENEHEYNIHIISNEDYKRTKARIIFSLQNTIRLLNQNILNEEYNDIMNKDSKKQTPETKKKQSAISQKEIIYARKQLDLLLKKKHAFELKLIISYSTEERFSLKLQIKDIDKQIRKLKKLLASADRDEKVAQPTKPVRQTAAQKDAPPAAPSEPEYPFDFSIPGSRETNRICCLFGAGNMGAGLVVPCLVKAGCRIVLINRPGDKWKDIVKPDNKELLVKDSNGHLAKFFVIHDSLPASRKESIVKEWITQKDMHLFLLTRDQSLIRKILKHALFITTALKGNTAYQWCSQMLNDCGFPGDTFIYPFENSKDAVTEFKRSLTNDKLKVKEVIADRMCADIKIGTEGSRGLLFSECEAYSMVAINHPETQSPFYSSNFKGDEMKFARTDKEFEFYHKRKFTLFNCVHAMLSCYIYDHLIRGKVSIDELENYQLNVFNNTIGISDNIRIMAQAEIISIMFGLDHDKELRNIIFPGCSRFDIYTQLRAYSDSIFGRIFSTRDKLHRVLPMKEFSTKYHQRIKDLIIFYDDNNLKKKWVMSVISEIRQDDNKMLMSYKDIKNAIDKIKTLLLDLATGILKNTGNSDK